MTEPNTATSYSVGFLLVLAANLGAYAVHLLAGGAFALPPGWLAVLLPLDGPLAYGVGWITHGVLSGDWRFPIVPTPAPIVRASARRVAARRALAASGGASRSRLA